MHYLLMIYSDEDAWSQMTPAEQEQGIAAYYAYTEALTEAGAHVHSNRLQPVSAATTVRMVDGKPQVLDGPYIDSKEQFGGYFMIEAANLDAALEWAARCPGASHGAIEVRPVWDMPS